MDTVIYGLEQMTTLEEAPEIMNGYPNFECRPGNPITDE